MNGMQDEERWALWACRYPGRIHPVPRCTSPPAENITKLFRLHLVARALTHRVHPAFTPGVVRGVLLVVV